jgi:hypothetical protein
MTALTVILFGWFGASAVVAPFIAMAGRAGHVEDVALGYCEH